MDNKNVTSTMRRTQDSTDILVLDVERYGLIPVEYQLVRYETKK